MRQILSRGKRTDNGEWVNGYYAKCRGRHYILPLCNEKGYDERYEDFIEVIPETVGQYTGLTDKNGKKIFEGDIVNTDFGVTGIACWNKKYLTFDFAPKDGESELLSVVGNLEIVGNAYDNSKYGRNSK